MENTIQYIANPDVSCREEGEDGALLFNPDTDQVLVINITGLLIWQTLAEPHRQNEVVAALREQCENVPAEAISQDVAEFLQQMVDKGFVGIHERTA